MLPKALLWSFTFNALLGFVMAVTLTFTLGNVETILESLTGMLAVYKRRTACTSCTLPQRRALY